MRPFIRSVLALALLAGAGLAVKALDGGDPAPPAPRATFGDHAEYDVTGLDFVSGQAVPAVTGRLHVDVGPETTIADAWGRPTLATPMVFSFEHAMLDGVGQVAWTYWVADREVIAVSKAGSAAISQAQPGVPEAADSTQSLTWSEHDWSARVAPCGFAGEAGCGNVTGTAGPWPVHVVWPRSDLLGSAGPGPIGYQLDLTGHGRAASPNGPAAPVAAMPSLGLAERQSSGPAGRGPGELSLQEAVDALIGSPTDSSGRDLMQRHPDTYTAYARLYHAQDATGGRQETWHIVLAGGSEIVERAVVWEAPPVGVDLIPPSIQVVALTSLDYPVDPPPAVFPPASLAPPSMPDLDDLRLAFAGATSREPNVWGFSVSCTNRLCNDVETLVTMSAEDLAGPRPDTARWQRALAATQALIVDGDGRLLAVESTEFGERTPDLFADTPFAPAERTSADPGPTFPLLPETPIAVSVGVAGIVAAALVAAWPHLHAWGLFSRIAPDRLLDHPVRRRIVDLVQEEPGIHAREVASRLGIGGNTATHHLTRLTGGGYLGERRIGGYHCYFPRTGLDDRFQAAVPVLKSRGAQAVLLAVEDQGAPSFQALMAATSLGYATVHHHAQRLWKAGLLSSEKDGKMRRFRLTELGRRLSSEARASLDRFPKLPKKAPRLEGVA